MKWWFFFTLIFSSFVASAEIDICVPAFPEIQDFFSLTEFQTEGLLSANVLANCVALIFVGAFSDKYGKKKVIEIGFYIFLIGTVCCIFANSYATLLVARVIQGIGVSAPMSLITLFVFDKFKPEKQQQAVNFLAGASTLSICVAPLLGAYMTIYMGWRGTFLALIVLGILAVCFNYFNLENDQKKDSKGVKKSDGFFSGYAEVFRNKSSMIAIFAVTISIGLYYCFVGMAPLILIKSMGVKIEDFGFYQGILVLSFGVCSILSGFFVNQKNIKYCYCASIFLILLFLAIMLYALLFKPFSHPAYFTLTIVILSVGAVVTINTLYVFAINSVPHLKSITSSMINIGKSIFAAVGMQLSSYFYTDDFRSTALVMVCMEFLALFLTLCLFIKDVKFKKVIGC
jgi:MFS transporter, DHA1 family, multidrug resistance protein